MLILFLGGFALPVASYIKVLCFINYYYFLIFFTFICFPLSAHIVQHFARRCVGQLQGPEPWTVHQRLELCNGGLAWAGVDQDSFIFKASRWALMETWTFPWGEYHDTFPIQQFFFLTPVWELYFPGFISNNVYILHFSSLFLFPHYAKVDSLTKKKDNWTDKY